MKVRLRSRRQWAFNAWIGAALALGVVVAANRLAKQHLRLRVDLSEEKLFAPSAVGERMLASLEDVLSVKVFFTGDVKHGSVQIAKSRLLDQLREYEDAARGRMELTFADPAASSEAKLEAQRYGVAALPLTAWQGTTEVTQEVHLGMVLRYRGREAVLPWVLPQSFAYSFLSELAGLMREKPLPVGFLAGGGDPEEEDAFDGTRRLIAARYPLRELVGLADGDPVPADVRLAVVARPDGLHPRAAFALDQFVQRGGRLLILAERVAIDLEKPEARLVTTGLEEVLAAWGVTVDPDLVWDQQALRLGFGGAASVDYPFWFHVGADGLEVSVPATGRLNGAELFWAHPLEIRPVEGVEAIPLLRSSESSWEVDADQALFAGAGEGRDRAIELLATEAPRRRTVAAYLTGSLPSAFAEEGAPAPRDAVAEALWKEAVRAALEEGREPPEREIQRTSEPVLSAGEGSEKGAVVVFGDADWISTGRFTTENNQLLFENLVDWLLLEHDLVELRASLPKERKIKDLLREEKERRGLPLLAGTGTLSIEGVDPKLLAAAEKAAERRRLLAMAAATGGSLALATALALAGRLLCGGRWR